jgi:hypothetical protein
MNTIPGDWTTRGTVTLAETRTAYYGGDPSRVELLRGVALALRAGQVMTRAGREEGILVVAYAHSEAPYRARRAATLAVLG